MALRDRLPPEVRRTSEGPPPEAAVQHDEDLIPDVGDTYERTETDNEIDQLTNGIDILDAYAKWCGKMVPRVGKKTESIMISCPMPDHRDRTPSAWINTDKQTWYCGTCNFGGDKYDIAAFHYGIDDYKTGKNFPDLKRRIAEDEGYVIKRTMTGVEYIEPIREESDSTLPALAGAEPAEHFGANPDKSEPDDDDDDDDDDEQDTGPLGLDLNRLTPMDSKFLRPLMDIACTDDAPWEFYFWQGLQLLGLAVGRDTVLDDRHPVTGNLFLCLTSDTGNRKSTTINAIRKLVREAFPYDQKDPVNEGVKIIGEPGSAEHLIDAFNKPVYDPDDEKEKEVLRFAPVRGLVEYSEFSMLTSRGSRSGSALKPTLHSFYDCEDEVSTGSRAHGDTIAHEPFAAVITTVQPKVLRELLTRDDALSGFLNRWIFVYGTTKPVVPYGGKRLRLDRCVDPLRGIRAWGAMHKVRYPDGLRLSPEAADIYRGFYVDTIEPAKEADNSSLLTRIDLTIKKLALLFAIDRNEEEVSGTTMQDVLSTYPYLLKTYKMVAGQIADSDLDVIVKDILKILAPNRSGLRMAVLNKRLRDRGHPTEQIVRALKATMDTEQISSEVVKPKGGGRGRPATVYRLNLRSRAGSSVTP